jgi:hypothetical protein
MDLYFGLVERKMNFLRCIQNIEAHRNAKNLQGNGFEKRMGVLGNLKERGLSSIRGNENLKVCAY